VHIPRVKIDDITSSLNSAVVLSAILKHNGTLSVPVKEFESLINNIQMWPNDYLTQNFGEGHMMVEYNHKTDSLDFSLGRRGNFVDSNKEKNSFIRSFICLRNSAKFGYVNHDSPRYKD